jgi:thiamine-phosphate pyrophosphorylase
MTMNLDLIRLCLVTDRGLARGRSLVDVVGAAARGGVTMVQLREKTATTREFLDEARALKTLLAPLGIPLIINDRVDIALAIDADGVHVGQKDMPVEQVRAMIGPGKIIGLSITNSHQLARP